MFLEKIEKKEVNQQEGHLVSIGFNLTENGDYDIAAHK
jgi:hypothetical protein